MFDLTTEEVAALHRIGRDLAASRAAAAMAGQRAERSASDLIAADLYSDAAYAHGQISAAAKAAAALHRAIADRLDPIAGPESPIISAHGDAAFAYEAAASAASDAAAALRALSHKRQRRWPASRLDRGVDHG